MAPTNVTLSLAHLAHYPIEPAHSYPALIALHGRGARFASDRRSVAVGLRPTAHFPHDQYGRGSHAGDLIGLAPLMDDGWLWISPRAPLELGDGFEWYRLAAVGAPEPASFAVAVATLSRFLAEALAAYPIDPARVVLLGFSQGGMMAHALALTEPGSVSAVIAHSSYIPLQAIQSAFTVEAAGLRGKPVLLLHGTHDPVIPVEWGRAARDTLASLGAQAEYFEFAGGHQVTNSSLTKMREWVRRSLTPNPSPSERGRG